MSIEKFDHNAFGDAEFIECSLKQDIIPYTQHLTFVLQNLIDRSALGLWCYLTSLPQNWNVNRQHLINHFGCSGYSIDRDLKTLRDNKLLFNENKKDTLGRWHVSLIHIKAGKEFMEHIRNQKVSENVEKKYTDNATVPPKNGETDNPGDGYLEPTKENIYTNENIIKHPAQARNFDMYKKRKESDFKNLASVEKQSTSYKPAPYEKKPLSENASIARNEALQRLGLGDKNSLTG